MIYLFELFINYISLYMILMINLFIIMLIMHALWGRRPHFLGQQLLEQLCNDHRHRGLIGARVCVHRRVCVFCCSNGLFMAHTGPWTPETSRERMRENNNGRKGNEIQKG